MSEFKVGDKVRRVSPDNDHAFWNEPDDGVFHGNIYTVKDFGVDSIGLVGCTHRYKTSNFELAESATKPFTKADLKDGTLLWERGEQTQAQQEYEELQKTIKELQNKADALGKLIK